MTIEGEKENTPPREILPSPELVQKIVGGFHVYVDGGKACLQKKLTDLNQYKHFFSLDAMPDDDLDNQVLYIERYLKGIGSQHAFEWIVFHPQLSKEDAQQVKEKIKLRLDSYAQIQVSARDIMSQEGGNLFDRLLNFANDRGINESSNLIIIDNIGDLSSEELGRFMFDLYIWPDNPHHRFRSKIIMYLPAEVDYTIQTEDIPATAHKGGIRNTLNRTNYLMVYEKH